MQVYFQGRRTPDGPLVTRHDPPDFAGVALPEAGYDWGGMNAGAVLLAEDLLTSAWGTPPFPPERDDFARWVVAFFDREAWRTTLGEVLTWNDRADRMND
jgi:hypothetical protein